MNKLRTVWSILVLSFAATAVAGPLPDFINGIDDNYYLAFNQSRTYKDGGVAIPGADLPYKYFAGKGVNFARIRCWIGDQAEGNYASALANARRAEEAGVHTMIIIYLSDGWEGYGDNPAATIFQGLSFANKKTAVQAYCRDLVTRFENDGVRFDLYEVGNENDYGICGETNRANMAQVWEAAFAGIRQVDPDAKFVVQIARSWVASFTTQWFNEMVNTHGVSMDHAAISYYPVMSGHPNIDYFKNQVRQIYADTGKSVIVPEWAYPDQVVPSQFHWGGVWGNYPMTGYPLTPQGQADLVRDLLQWGMSEPALKGVFYWSPMFNSVAQYWDWGWYSLFTPEGEAKPAVTSLQYGAAPDSDGDGLADYREGTGDPDGDSTPSHLDDDSDGDGILDSVETWRDQDGDGDPNFLDLDSDNDGLPDTAEGVADPDGDGLPNHLDLNSDDDYFTDAEEAASGSNPYDYLDPLGRITVTAPANSAFWDRGETHTIRWQPEGDSGAEVSISLLKDGVVVRPVADPAPNTGNFAWAIPADEALGQSYAIRVTATSEARITDTSNGHFSISASPDANSGTWAAGPGFSSTQGLNRWYYGTWTDAAGYDWTTLAFDDRPFENLPGTPNSAPNLWEPAPVQPGYQYPTISNTAMSPGNTTANLEPARVWVAPAAGRAHITVRNPIANTSARSDGATAGIYKVSPTSAAKGLDANRDELWSGRTRVENGTNHVITSCTNAAPNVVTSSAHGLETGDQVRISDISGNYWANGSWQVTVIDADRFSLDTSVYNAGQDYLFGGQWIRLEAVEFSPDIEVDVAEGDLIGFHVLIEQNNGWDWTPFEPIIAFDADSDGDGLLDSGETNSGTDPNNADSDGDGLQDGAEVLTHGTNPLVEDTDSDGLSDSDELGTYDTNPLDADTDGDGSADGDEVEWGTNPLDSEDVPRVPAVGLVGLLFAAGLVTAAGARRRG